MKKVQNRWIIAVSGIIMQLILGTVYGWSVFKKPLMEAHGWSGPNVGLAFTIVIFFIGIAAAVGGKFVDKAGARKVATTAAILFGLGTLIAGYAVKIGNLWLLWFGYGLLGGIGNGLGYITPIAVLVRWFPDKKGVITGLAVMGFGFGSALIGLTVPSMLTSIGIANTFYILGVIYLVVLWFAAQNLVNPPEGWTLPATQKNAAKVAAPVVSVDLKVALGMYQFYLLWLVLFINVLAGLSIISNLSPMAQNQLGVNAVFAGTLIFITSIFNGLGRIVWAALSDKIGRKTTFLIMLSTQIPIFFLLPKLTNVWVFAILSCYVLSCYGGGFATMPAFAVDTFGAKNMGAIYGKILIAWGFAGVGGPMLMEYFKKVSDSFTLALWVASGLLFLGVILVSLYNKPKSAVAAA